MQITPAEIAETLAMVGQQHLDIRTITMGISLLWTDRRRGHKPACEKIYDKICRAAPKTW